MVRVPFYTFRPEWLTVNYRKSVCHYIHLLLHSDPYSFTVLCTITMVHNSTSSYYMSVDWIELWSCLLYLSIYQQPPSSVFMILYICNFLLPSLQYLLVSCKYGGNVVTMKYHKVSYTKNLWYYKVTVFHEVNISYALHYQSH